MTASCFAKAMCFVVLGCGTWSNAAPPPWAASTPTRPTITQINVTLEDGRVYNVTPQQLADPKGGALFWGEWAVANILAPHYSYEPEGGFSAAGVWNLWTSPGDSGQLPAFLVNTSKGPVYPLDPGGAQGSANGSAHRPQVMAIHVGYADGRLLSLNQFALRDARSGVIIWNDFAVAALFIPFYLLTPSVPTRPYDVLRLWNQPVQAPSAPAGATELPAMMVKPQCMPVYGASVVD